jgi:hypothetical protein
VFRKNEKTQPSTSKDALSNYNGTTVTKSRINNTRIADEIEVKTKDEMTIQEKIIHYSRS